MFLVILFGISSLLICDGLAEKQVIIDPRMQHSNNSSLNNTDMYVVHAVVYQVGILTNKTNDEQSNKNFTGKQEAITFYNNEGLGLDLSKIRNPLQTNITAQDVVGISGSSERNIDFNTTSPLDVFQMIYPTGTNYKDAKMTAPVVSSNKKRLVPVEIRNVTAKIPEEIKIKSIEIPPLLVLNNNFSKIPVPVPNTSVISYAKVNTVVRNP